MKKTVKISLIGIAAILVSLISIFAIISIGNFAGNFMDELVLGPQQEAEEFARDSNKQECLERIVDKYASCEDFSCFSSTASFGVVCLSAASGSRDQFCSDQPESVSEFYNGDWKDGLCKSKGLDTSSCRNMYKIVESYCAS